MQEELIKEINDLITVVEKILSNDQMYYTDKTNNENVNNALLSLAILKGLERDKNKKILSDDIISEIVTTIKSSIKRKRKTDNVSQAWDEIKFKLSDVNLRYLKFIHKTINLTFGHTPETLHDIEERLIDFKSLNQHFQSNAKSVLNNEVLTPMFDKQTLPNAKYINAFLERINESKSKSTHRKVYGILKNNIKVRSTILSYDLVVKIKLSDKDLQKLEDIEYYDSIERGLK